MSGRGSRAPAEIDKGAGSMGGTTFDGLGVEYYAALLVQIEQRYIDFQAQVALLDPADSFNLLGIEEAVQKLLTEVGSVRSQVIAEQQRLLALPARNGANGLLATMFPTVRDQWIGQFEAAASDYDLLLEAIDLSTDDWRSWLADTVPALQDADGMIVCGAGHKNHPTRVNCVLCGRSLLANS